MYKTTKAQYFDIGLIVLGAGPDSNRDEPALALSYVKKQKTLYAMRKEGFCTRSGNRTRTTFKGHRILSPACLPVPPSEQMVKRFYNTVIVSVLLSTSR